MKKTVEYRKKEDAFYIKETNQIIAKNTLPPDATDKQIQEREIFYTNTINNIQQEQQNKAQQAFLALTDFGITAIDSWNAADELAKDVGEFTFEVSNKPYQLKGSRRIRTNSYKPYTDQHPVLSKVNEKTVEGTLLHCETEVEIDRSKNRKEMVKEKDVREANKIMSGKLVGATVNQAKDRMKDVKSMADTINESKVIYDKFNQGKRIDFKKDMASTKEFGWEQLGEFFSVWAPAIVEVKGWDKYQGIQDPTPREVKEFKADVQAVVKCNRTTAHVMETLMTVGFLLFESPTPITITGGLILIILAQPISNSVREILLKEINNEGNELRFKDYLGIIIDNIIEWFDITRFIGENDLCLRQEYNKKPLIQEMKIDAPGLIGGIKSFISDGPFEKIFIQLENLILDKDVAAFDPETYGNQLEEKYFAETKIKNIEMYYGTLTTIGEFIKDKDKDFSFVGFFDCEEKAEEIMERIVTNTFKKIEGKEKYQVYAYKEVEHAPDIPRLIHRSDKNKSNQIVVYRTKEQGLEAPAYFKAAAPGPAQMAEAASVQTKTEIRPKPYLNQLKKSFSKKYLKRLLKQKIEVGYGAAWYDNDYYYMMPLKSLLIEQAKEHGLDLTKDELSYQQILNQYHNRKFVKDDLVGGIFAKGDMKYDYIMMEDNLFPGEHNFFRPNWNIMYGSLDNQKHDNQEKTNKDSSNENSTKENSNLDEFKFWTGLGSTKTCKQPENIKKAKIIINGERIGKNLERKLAEEDIFDVIADEFFKEREYIETFEKGDGRVLEVRYRHLSYRSFFKTIINPTLKIKYRYKHKETKKTYPWNRVTIKRFDDLDYGIDLPDKGYSLAGTEYDGKIKEERITSNLIKTEEVTEKGRGKIKIDGKYLKADELTIIETKKEDKKKSEKTYKVRKGDTLWGIAEDFLGEGNRWNELKKEDGSTYSEEEAKEIQIGSKVFIPRKDKKKASKVYQDTNGNKYTKDSEGNLFINYLNKNDKTETLYIPGFQEGDYGLWIEKEAPYYLDGNTIVNNATGEKAKKNKVMNEKDNKWLKEEERIKDNFLWIYQGEEIIFPESEEKNKEKKSKQESQANSTGAAAAATQGNSQTNKKNNNQQSNNNSTSESVSSGGARFYVCDGAKLKCSQGDKKSTFEVIDTHNVYIQGKPMATIEDSKPMVNIKPFGKCKSMSNPTVAAATAANNGNLKPMPCQPNIPGPWQDGKDDVTIADILTVLETSKLQCAYAGVIKVVDPGQDLVME